MASGGVGDKVVGRLTIRVSPDMDGFRGEVERGANAAARETHPEIPVDADTTKARRKIKELEDDRGRINLDVDADTAAANAKIAEAARPRKVNLKADFDESALDRVKKNIDRFLTNENIEIGKAHQRLMAVMRDAAPKPRKFDLKLDDQFDYQLRNRVRKAAESAARDAERALGKIGGGNNRRGGFLPFTALGNAFSNFKVPDLVPNIGGLGGFGSIAIIVGALSLVAPALSLLSQALVGLPALIGAVALPIGTLALGFDGIKKALDGAGLLDIITGKSKKDGTKGKDKNEPGEVIKKLKDQVSDVFATGLTPVFTQFANILPRLTQGLPFVAQGLVKLAEGFGNIIASPAFLSSFDRFTNSVGTMLTNLSPALQLFTNGMMNLITNVGDHLPGLGNKMTEWAGEFTSWVDEISKPKQWWGKDIPNSSTLDKAISNIGPILDTLLNSIGGLLDKGLQMAGSGDLTKGIQDAIIGLEHLLDQLTRLGPAFEAISNILSIVPSAPIDKSTLPKNPDGSINQNTPQAQQAAQIDQTNDAWKNGLIMGIPIIGTWIKDGLPLLSKGYDWLKTNLGPGLSGVANADEAPFNPGTKVGTTAAPVPVQVVQGSQSNLAPLFPGVPGGPSLTPPPAPVPPVAPGGAQPPIQPPKIEAPKAPEGSDKIWQPLIEATQKAGADINTEVNSWAGKIKSALDSAAAGANASGVAIGTQMAAGIAAGAPAAIDAARALAQGVKDVLPHSPAKDPNSPFGGSKWGQVKSSGTAIASSFADGLTDGFDGVVSASKRLMEAVHQSMDQNGILPPNLTAAVQKESSAIGIELDRLKAQRDALDPKDKAGRAAIKSQMDELRGLKDEFGLTGKESKYNSKYGGAEGPFTAQNVGSMITQQIADGLNGALGFGKANLSQLETDLGMSGNGVVEQLGDYGINFLSSGLNSLAQGFFGGGQQGNTFNFNSMDHDGMMQDYKRVQNRESMAFTQRTN